MPLAHKYHLWVLLCIILRLVLEKRSSIDFGYVLHHPAQEFDIISPFDEERAESITVGMIVLYIRTNSANPDELTLRYVVGNMFRMT